MKVTEKVTRDCCRAKDLKIIGETAHRRNIFQCKHCNQKWEEEWCGPGNNDFLLRKL